MRYSPLIVMLGVGCYTLRPNSMNYTLSKIEDSIDVEIIQAIDETCSPSESQLFLNSERFQEDGDLFNLPSVWTNLESSYSSVGGLNMKFSWFSRFPVDKFLEHICHKDSVTILYPGAGDDISPLQLSPMLQEAGVSDINFIYTEIVDEAEQYFHSELKTLQKKGLVTNISVERVDYPELELGEYAKGLRTDEDYFAGQTHSSIAHTTEFEFIIEGEYLTKVMYAVNMSGENYFREEDAQVSDIILTYASGIKLDEVESRYLALREEPSVVVTNEMMKDRVEISNNYFSRESYEGYFSDDYCSTHGLFVHFVGGDEE